MRLRRGITLTKLLAVGVADEQGFDLADQIVGAERLYEHRVRLPIGSVFPFDLLARWGIGRQQGGGGIVALALGGPNYFHPSLFGFHTQITDHHVIGGGLQASERLGGSRGRFYFESMEFQNRLEGEKDGQIIVDEKNAPFQFAPLIRRSRCSVRARNADSLPNAAGAIHSVSIGEWPGST